MSHYQNRKKHNVVIRCQVVCLHGFKVMMVAKEKSEVFFCEIQTSCRE